MPIHCRSHESWGTDYQHVGTGTVEGCGCCRLTKGIGDYRALTQNLCEKISTDDFIRGASLDVSFAYNFYFLWDLANDHPKYHHPCTRNRSRVMPFALPFSSIPGVKVWMVLGAIVVSLGEGIQILVFKVVNRLISQISHRLHQTFNVCMYIYIVLAAEIDVVIYFSSCAWFSIIRFTRKSYNTTPAYALLIYSECRYANICHVFVGSSKRENVRDTHLRTGRLVGSKL